MDIQAMVESRISELRTQKLKDAHRDNRERRDAGKYLSELSPDMVEFRELLDEKLAEVTARVLEIAEKVAVDYSRLEKDMLRSRLSILELAEAVLDITRSLKQRSKELVPPEPVTDRAYSRDAAERRELESLLHPGTAAGAPDRRASMHENGVASLFRRTQD